uniref:Uncharacterized protein n=1 Tax=Strongyloides venezuelensis TaxID=75913 RepID=A0A0K0FR12_STRVS
MNNEESFFLICDPDVFFPGRSLLRSLLTIYNIISQHRYLRENEINQLQNIVDIYMKQMREFLHKDYVLSIKFHYLYHYPYYLSKVSSLKVLNCKRYSYKYILEVDIISIYSY